MANTYDITLSRTMVLSGAAASRPNPIPVVLARVFGMAQQLLLDVYRAGESFLSGSMVLAGFLRTEVIRQMDTPLPVIAAPIPQVGNVITQRRRLIDEVGKRLALLARSLKDDRFASTPDEDDLMDSWYENAFNRISIETGNQFASDVNAYTGGYSSPAGPQLNNVRFEALNLDGQTIEYLVLDESSAGTSIYLHTVKPAAILVGMKEFTVFVRGSGSTVSLNDIFVKSFIVEGLPKYVLVTYQAEARRDIQYVLPPELEKCVVYWMLYEWCDSIGEPKYSAQYLEKYKQDLREYRFTPRNPSMVERKSRWF